MKKIPILLALLTSCAWTSAGNLLVSVVDKEGKPVADAVVIISPTDKTVLPKLALANQVTVLQEKMQFVPAISLAPVGAKVRFVNADPWDHHVRSSPAGMGQFNATNAGFELRLEGKSDGKPAKPVEVTLDKAGVLGATLLGCFIHGSMRGYIYASESPWAAKTNADGIASFEELPNGSAQIKVWQSDQVVDVPPQQAMISANPAKSVFQLTVTPRRRRS